MAGTREKIRIGLAQVNPVVGDLEGNAALVRKKIAEAKKLGVQVLAFPELILCGYPTEDLLLKPSFLADCERILQETAEAARGMAVIVGSPESVQAGGKRVLYNTAPVLYRGKVAARYRKLNLPNYGVFDEKRYFTAGENPLVVEFGDIPVGISICEDIWIEDGPASIESSCGGAGILINISASPYHMLKGRERERLMQRRARQYGAYLCYVNLLGGQDELVFDGSSVICSPDGKTLARARSFHEDLIVADIPVPGSKNPCNHSEEVHSIKDQVETVSLPGLPARKRIRLRTKKIPRHRSPAEEVYEALVTGTRDYVEKNGFHGVVLGISGGIDSALTAAIAVDALGPLKVNGITMPSGYTSSPTLKDARKLASNLGIPLYELPIASVYDSYLDLLGGILPSGEIGVTEENIQARVRGNLLMAMSNRFGWLVLTTGNKSEVAVGYCTLYGDMAGGFAVLKDVPKTLVYKLSRYRNRISEYPVIPQSTIRRAPSAELRPDQRDQDTLPPYALLDRIIELYVEKDMSLAGIVEDGIDAETAAAVIRMIDLNEYKRRQGPPGIKITPRAFGRDRRLPITNRYRVR